MKKQYVITESMRKRNKAHHDRLSSIIQAILESTKRVVKIKIEGV